jgi:catechol 2,3-dioxygenase-like lactoylglutathione lyase family enzyme
MPAIATGAVHHIALTVSDIERSVDFYSRLGFQRVVDLPNKVLMSNGSVILAVGAPPNPAQAPARDSFSENRIGLDHLSFSVNSRRDLDDAMRYFEQNKLPHGGIEEMAPLGIAALAFRDPDNIQVELTSPIA